MMEKFALEAAGEMVEVMRDYSGHNLKDFRLMKVKLDSSPRRVACRGGWYSAYNGPAISMATKNWEKPVLAPTRFYEYPSFNEHPVIGGFFFTKRPIWIRAVIAHEIAHAAQYYLVYKYDQHENPLFMGHQDVFKELYAVLRKSCVNTLIEDQKVLQQEYQSLLRNAQMTEFAAARSHIYAAYGA